ncbi:hypothetical protein FC83_GL002866 [Agrilactobacillus composti DSM 18527 = JCM 14202]|uniref:Shikimate kinase n=1 Tax=Agrilactobacillus composti DSM 18527 = JCM 14202 TaxID=1423734 RepID=A0A0R1Y1X5_9LACO|nr:shikimate kinase [Agrilactobacillus composti]KRM33299.1 hypothetical protein FC83_GL002866 [Agrilactobacillus composti DSM 18527 = JCM 14202]
MMARLVLVGFMGAGKTTVGQLLAQNTGFRFTDLDQAIVEIAGRPIPDIFAAEGEAGFRRRETEALAQALDQDVIVSTGGGIVTQAQNRALLKAAGAPVVYLKADPEVLYQRVYQDENRPIANSLDLSGFTALAAERELFYHEVSDLVLTTANLSPLEVMGGILDEIQVK